MLAAIAIHLTIILAIIVPSFIIDLVPKILSDPASMIRVLCLVQATSGAFAAGLGIWMIGAWQLRKLKVYSHS